MKLIRSRPIIPIGSTIGILGAWPSTVVMKKAMVQQTTSAKGSTPMQMKILAILRCCPGDIFSFEAAGSHGKPISGTAINMTHSELLVTEGPLLAETSLSLNGCNRPKAAVRALRACHGLGRAASLTRPAKAVPLIACKSFNAAADAGLLPVPSP